MKNKTYNFFFCVLFLVCKLGAQINNIDFELTPAGAYTTANAVSGWTISSQTSTNCNSSAVWTPGSTEFSLISTPQLSIPNIGVLLNSPLGGTVVAQLNNYTANSSVTRLAQTFSVTSLNANFQFAYAGMWQNATHSCCEQAGFKVMIYDQAGNPITCPSYTLAGAGCSSIPTYTLSGTTYWTNWQMHYIDLSGYIGSNVTIEAKNYDCIYGDHYGTVFFDAKANNCNCTNTPITPTINIHFCSGNSIASMNAPAGYQQYFWAAPALYPITNAQSTLATLSLTNAVVGSIYTLTTYPANPYCSYTNTFALVNTSVSILGIGSSSSCAIGTSGSATVVAGGSGSGYNYTWTNSTNSVVGNSGTLTSLAPGAYTVNVTASGTQSINCGTASATTTVGIRPPGILQVLKPFCGAEAYLSYPGGSNYQWYNNLTPITASLGGTSSSYTVNSPINSSIYWLSYISPQGCHDSLKLTLVPVPSGNISLLSNATICQGATNGTAVISMTPAAASPSGANSFSVFSVGLIPSYSSSLSPTASNTFSATSLSAGSIYSVIAFDGLCKYSTSFTVPSISFDYSLSLSSSSTICSGNSIAAHVTYTSSITPGQYTYSWSPATFLFVLNTQNTIISPTVSPGNSSTLIYSVVVTPTLANCPLTKTLSIIVANPLTPTITPLPQLCSNGTPYLITVNPSGGSFINGSGSAIGSSSGILNPSLSNIGVNTFTYSNSIGNCVAKSSASYTVNPLPNITVAGNTLMCEGQSVTLLASGANSYTWSNLSLSPFITVTPSLTTSYSVVGKDAITNCLNSKNIVLNIEPYPTLSIFGNTLLCLGETTTLTASGASIYSWSNGFSSPSITISPTVTSTYSLVGTSALASCSNTQAVTVNVELCNLTTLLKRNTDKNLIVYPNPSGGKFFIEAKNILSIIVADALGKIILEEHFQKENYQIDLSKYQNGVYLLKVFHNNEIKTLKLIKIN